MDVLDVLLQLVLRCETQLADAAAIRLPVLPLAVDEQVLLQGGLHLERDLAHLADDGRQFFFSCWSLSNDSKATVATILTSMSLSVDVLECSRLSWPASLVLLKSIGVNSTNFASKSEDSL